MDITRTLDRSDGAIAHGAQLPEFRVPIEQVVPGMALSRNLVHRGLMLLRHGSVLESAQIERLREQQVDFIYIHFCDEDVDFYKRLVLQQDRTPPPEDYAALLRDTLNELVPHFARPEHCTRDRIVAGQVRETMDHTFDLLLRSARCMELLRMTRLFHLRPVRHCPAAWSYALCIGAGLGYKLPQLLDLSLAALFYDIGMLKLRQKVLTKPGKLSAAEWGEVRKHTFFGRRLLEQVNSFSSTAAQVAFEHHENYYGGGYPKNKRGSSIHEFSQIVSVADKFAALLTAKQHRAPFQPYEAYELMLAQTRSSVSPRIFIAFLKHVLLYPRGSQLRLSNGEIAEPVGFPLQQPTRPKVLVTHNSEGLEAVGPPKVIDLALRPELRVESFAIVESGLG